MKREEILSKLNEIFCIIFDDDTLKLTESTSADDIEDWDSMEQINILMACEEKFQIKFDVKEAAMLACAGDIVDLLENKLN